MTRALSLLNSQSQRSLLTMAMLLMVSLVIQPSTLQAGEAPEIFFDDADGIVHPGQTFTLISSTVPLSKIAMFIGTQVSHNGGEVTDARLFFVATTNEEDGTHSMSITVPDDTPEGVIYFWLFGATVKGFSDPTPLVIANEDEGSAEINGALIARQPISMTFTGPFHNETDSDPNPFMDYRLTVFLTSPSGNTYDVPGFFNGDSNGNSGDNWRICFIPPEDGTWTWEADFRTGTEIAIDLNLDNGDEAYFDGLTGSFDIAPFDPQAPGFYAKGRIKYDGGHYPRFEDGSYFISACADSPENILAYEGIPHTVGTHRFEEHQDDYIGEPLFYGDSGYSSDGLLGALNYLSDQGMNTIYLIPMNIGGDGKDVWPYPGDPDPDGNPDNDNLHFDLEKMRVWDIVFSYAAQKGIALHVIFNEAETANKTELDDGVLGPERMLYYREMMARFGYHNMLINLCEEPDLNYYWDGPTLEGFAQYMNAFNHSGNPVGIHNWKVGFYVNEGIVGNPNFQFGAVQSTTANKGDRFEEWRADSEAMGYSQIWIHEEPKTTNKTPLSEYTEIILQSLLSGAAGFGMFVDNRDQSLENFRNYTGYIERIVYGKRFLEMLPFTEMTPQDNLISEGQAFAKEGEAYGLFLPSNDQGYEVDMSTDEIRFGSTIQIEWYNPETGIVTRIEEWVKNADSLELVPTQASENWAVKLTVLED